MSAPIAYLPFKENCTIDPRKLTDYLLDESRRGDPGSKVGLIRDVLGFSRPAELQWALLAHARLNPCIVFERRADRVLYNVTGPLSGPRGHVDNLVAAWQLADGGETPQLVTVLLGPRPSAT